MRKNIHHVIYDTNKGLNTVQLTKGAMHYPVRPVRGCRGCFECRRHCCSSPLCNLLDSAFSMVGVGTCLQRKREDKHQRQELTLFVILRVAIWFRPLPAAGSPPFPRPPSFGEAGTNLKLAEGYICHTVPRGP